MSSNGVFYAKAWDALKRFAEKAQIPVVESGAMKGQFSDASPLSANAAPAALASADLVILVGQHCMPTVGEFAFGPDARYIRIDQAAEDIGRNLPIDLGIVSCERAALEALADAMPRMTHDAWMAEIAAARKKFEDQNLEYYKTGLGYADAVHPAVIAKELGDFLYRGALPKEQTTIASGGYGIARYVRRELRALPARTDHERRLPVRRHRPGRGLRRGRRRGRAARRRAAGGVQGASDHLHHRRRGLRLHGAWRSTPWPSTGCRSSIIVYNNNAWGTWTGATQDPRALPIHLFQENLRYDKLAEALGGHGEYVTRPAEFRPALERAYQVAARERRPAVDQLPGEEGILGSREVPARLARQDRARRDVLLPLTPWTRRATICRAAGVCGSRCVPRLPRPRSARGRARRYEFLWLLRRPMRAVFDARRGVLTFAPLFPGVQAGSALVARPRRPRGDRAPSAVSRRTSGSTAVRARVAAHGPSRRLVARGDDPRRQSRVRRAARAQPDQRTVPVLHETYPDT